MYIQCKHKFTSGKCIWLPFEPQCRPPALCKTLHVTLAKIAKIEQGGLPIERGGSSMQHLVRHTKGFAKRPLAVAAAQAMTMHVELLPAFPCARSISCGNIANEEQPSSWMPSWLRNRLPGPPKPLCRLAFSSFNDQDQAIMPTFTEQETIHGLRPTSGQAQEFSMLLMMCCPYLSHLISLSWHSSDLLSLRRLPKSAVSPPGFVMQL